jgi:SP family arabinose:H+ symporter-like MFS transporter
MNRFLIKSSVVAALGGLLFGFDTAVISGAINDLVGSFDLSAKSLGFTVSSALLGTIIGALCAGIPGERFGRRDSLRGLAVLYFVSSVGCAISWNWPSLLLFRIVGGLAIGGSSVLGPMYIAEIAPAKRRGWLVGFFQFNIVLGILLAYFSNYLISLVHLGTSEWRWMLGVAAGPAAVFFVMLFGIPRSPRWLVKQERIEEARRVLRMTEEEHCEEELNSIAHSIKTECETGGEALFVRHHRLPIFLAISVGAFNQLSGINAVLYYLNYIFASAGFGAVSASQQAIVVGATLLVFTIVGMIMIDLLGRRPLLLVGSLGTAACLFGVAVIFSVHKHEGMLLWLLVAFIAFFAASQGAVIWVYISEVFPNAVRAKGQSLGSFSHWSMNALISLLFPMVAAVSGAYPFYFFGAMMILQFVVVLYLYPETKGIPLEELQDQILLKQAMPEHVSRFK